MAWTTQAFPSARGREEQKLADFGVVSGVSLRARTGGRRLRGAPFLGGATCFVPAARRSE